MSCELLFRVYPLQHLIQRFGDVSNGGHGSFKVFLVIPQEQHRCCRFTAASLSHRSDLELLFEGQNAPYKRERQKVQQDSGLGDLN